ncbi:MAG: AAA domain-containing protein [Bacteroides sp.]|nr:AAA domain-containing protein [Bacteroides sp.]
MELKETAFAYNVTTDNHSNSDWGQEIGQGAKKLMNVEGISEILNGMLYYKIEDINRIETILGKGNRTLKPLGDYAPDTSIVVASVFPKIHLNGKLLMGQSLIMFITKDERRTNSQGQPNVHYQRRGLKFSDKATFDGIPLNLQCIDAISHALGCSRNGSWIVTNIDFVDDYLELTATIVDKNNPYNFATKQERSSFLKRNRLAQNIRQYTPSTITLPNIPTILYGPPGTGKTYKLQHDYVDKFNDSLVEFTTFHQSFSYEEFVEGLKPTLGDSDTISYNIEKGVFYKACEKAALLAGYNSLIDAIKASKEDRKLKFDNAVANKNLVLLCIDEINRGNVASIFGDLISLIEPSKRLGNKDELILTLPYSKERFGVPSNLMIVGTMNTADRSIQLLDSALRRRFKFEELPPILDSISYEPAKNVLRAINNRIRAILNKDSQIGHAYFIDVTNDEETLEVIAKKIIPLLEEYFYNDIDKIRFVLNDYGDTAKFYLEDTETKKAYEHYTEIADMDSEEKKFFYLNPAISGIEGGSLDITSSNYLNQIIRE